MRVWSAAYHVAVIAAFLFLLPGHIGAGEAGARDFPRIRLAALAPEPALDQKPDRSLGGKWRAVRERIRAEQRLISECRQDPAACPSDAATMFMAVVDAAREREGRALLGEINRAVNLAVRPVSDQKRHGEDVWSSPLVTLSSGEGDCEDYAIAKLAALWAAGVAEADTRLVIVHDPRAQEDHAIAMARLEGRWLALDNRRFTLVEAEHLSYQPMFAIGDGWIRSFADRTSWAELDDSGLPAVSAGAGTETDASGTGAAPTLL
jgi:predicted transglutaminase-like cysteine proteinase